MRSNYMARKLFPLIRKHLLFLILSFFYFLSRFYLLESDYNIFDPSELFAANLPNSILSFSLYPYLIRLISLLNFSNYIFLPQRLVSIFSGYFLGLIVYFFSLKLDSNREWLTKLTFLKSKNKYHKFLPILVTIFFWLNPFIFYYSKIGQPAIFSLFLIYLAYFLFSSTKYQKLALLVLFLGVLTNVQLLIFSLSFYLCFINKKTDIIQKHFYFLIPSLFLLIFNFTYSNLIFLLPSFSLLFIYFLSHIHLFLPIISIFFVFPFTYLAYSSTIHTNLLDLKAKLKNYQQYYQYPIYTTFNQKELSVFFDQEIKWFDFNSLKDGGLLITDDVNSLNLDSKAKENAYLLYQTAISQNIQVYSSANFFSYFPDKYDKNTYRLYLILSIEDSRKIYQNME